MLLAGVLGGLQVDGVIGFNQKVLAGELTAADRDVAVLAGALVDTRLRLLPAVTLKLAVPLDSLRCREEWQQKATTSEVGELCSCLS